MSSLRANDFELRDNGIVQEIDSVRSTRRPSVCCWRSTRATALKGDAESFETRAIVPLTR